MVLGDCKKNKINLLKSNNPFITIKHMHVYESIISKRGNTCMKFSPHKIWNWKQHVRMSIDDHQTLNPYRSKIYTQNFCIFILSFYNLTGLKTPWDDLDLWKSLTDLGLRLSGRYCRLSLESVLLSLESVLLSRSIRPLSRPPRSDFLSYDLPSLLSPELLESLLLSLILLSSLSKYLHENRVHVNHLYENQCLGKQRSTWHIQWGSQLHKFWFCRLNLAWVVEEQSGL